MKYITIIITILLLSACNVNYPTTTFYVKNDSDRTVNFKASIMKYSSMGSYQMTLPFAVPAHDSILARQVGFHKEALPTQWFTDFTIFPSEGLIFNDPKIPENWVKSINSKQKPNYTFSITK